MVVPVSGAGQKPFLLAGAAVAVIIVRVVWWYVEVAAVVVLVAAAALAVIRLAVAVVRFGRLPVAARRYYPRACWAKIRWRWLTRNLGLARLDVHHNDKIRGQEGSGAARIRYPKARIRADAHGIRCEVRTIPGTGRAEFDKQADHLANHWRVGRVSVSQRAPGRLLIRGLARDPLMAPFPAEAVPAGLWQSGVSRPYAGLDEWAVHRCLDLRDISGVLIGGQPGTGKTNLVNSLLAQWAGSCEVQWAQLDGKGSADLSEWEDRAWLHAGDRLADAVAVLEDVHMVMRRRLRSVLELTGCRNSWHVGPSAAWPLLACIIDEFQVFLDVVSYKSDAKSLALAQRCVALVAELVRRGRSAMVVVVLVTQKATSDAAPSAITANCGLGLCFGVKTMEAAAAVLGPDIRDYASFSPTLLDPAYAGVATTNLRTGLDPYTRIRVPELTDAAIAARSSSAAGFRSDPAVLAVPVQQEGGGLSAAFELGAREAAQRSLESRAAVGRPA